MNNKTSKILTAIASGIILLAFFMPWTKSMFGISVSAWDMVRAVLNNLGNIDPATTNPGIFMPLVLLALPICSVMIIIRSLIEIENDNSTSKSPMVVSIVVLILFVLALIVAQSKNPFSDFSNVFNALGIGFYLTAIGNIYFFVDLITAKTATLKPTNSTAQTEIFCSNCGKQYYEADTGQFCEECGNKL